MRMLLSETYARKRLCWHFWRIRHGSSLHRRQYCNPCCDKLPIWLDDSEMNAADLWTFLEFLIDRNVPLHKTKVYVTVNGFDHVVTEPIHTLGPNGHEIHLADIESRIL